MKPRLVENLKEEVHLRVNRDTMLDSVPEIYKQHENLALHRLNVSFIGEKGDDQSGLTKEFFTMYWQAVFDEHFEGEIQFTPRVDPDTLKTTLQTLGITIAHAFVTLDYIPIQFNKVSFIAMLTNKPDEIPDQLINQTFRDILSEQDCNFLDDCVHTKDLTTLSDFQSKRLAGILARYGCRRLSKTGLDLQEYLLTIAKCELLEKPLYAITQIAEGMKRYYPGLWENVNMQDILAVYDDLSATAEMVAENLITKKETLLFEEQAAFDKLERYVLDSNKVSLSRFLKFVTACTTLLKYEKIEVVFNESAGFALQFSVMTCSNQISIPTSVSSYRQFKVALDNVLANPSSWEYCKE